ARSPDRRRRPRARDGAAARATRPARLLPPHRPQHPPVLRLVGVRADRDRDRRERALATGVRLRRRRVLESAVRRRRDRARLPRPGRLRAQVRAQVRRLDRDRVTRVPLLVVAPRPASGRPLAPPRHARVLAGLRPRARVGRQLDAARGGLHALLAFAQGRLLGRGARLLRPDRPAVRARRGDRNVAPDLRRARPAHRDRRGRRGERARPARADRRRKRRSVRERLLRRRQPPEPAAAGPPAPARRGDGGDRDRRCAARRPPELPAVPLPARLVLRSALCGAARGLGARRTALRAPRRLRGAGRPRRDGRRLARRLLPVSVALPAGPGLVDAGGRAHAPARASVGRRVAAELRRRVRPGHPRPPHHPKETYPRERVIALLGNLACDLFPDGVPRVGGGAYHGGRALRRLRVPARIVTRCARAQRDVLLPPLVRMGTPVRWMAGESTATFEFEFHGEERKMQAVELGDVWRPGDLSMLPSTRWVHIAPLFRGEFPTETLAALARRCRVSFDAQGLVRAPELGPLHLDANYDPEILRHLWVLKLA